MCRSAALRLLSPPNGEVLAEGTEPIILITLDRNILDQVRGRYPGYLPVRADLYAEGWKSVTSHGITAPRACESLDLRPNDDFCEILARH